MSEVTHSFDSLIHGGQSAGAGPGCWRRSQIDEGTDQIKPDAHRPEPAEVAPTPWAAGMQGLLSREASRRSGS